MKKAVSSNELREKKKERKISTEPVNFELQLKKGKRRKIARFYKAEVSSSKFLLHMLAVYWLRMPSIAGCVAAAAATSLMMGWIDGAGGFSSLHSWISNFEGHFFSYFSAYVCYEKEGLLSTMQQYTNYISIYFVYSEIEKKRTRFGVAKGLC